jgi:hypothetical protein
MLCIMPQEGSFQATDSRNPDDLQSLEDEKC